MTIEVGGMPWLLSRFFHKKLLAPLNEVEVRFKSGPLLAQGAARLVTYTTNRPTH
ncbi:hypothetical protein [Actinoplanes italicus]|uniref:hypothetical protein n=1 Tax=Actinoplanes italicus TaxID=113567 RepID=UPI001473CA15|nr:hypothetical protein [Actinoplanes italicus]